MLFGVGYFGCAIVLFDIFVDYGFCVVVIFDKDKDKIGEKVGSMVVRLIDDFKQVVEEEDIVVGVLVVFIVVV